MTALNREETSGIAIVTTLPEILDAGNSEQFKADIVRLLADCRHAVIDMNTVHFIDSSGCGALIAALRHVRRSGGELKLCGVGSQVRRVFELTRMHRIMGMYATREQALDSFRQE